MGWLERLKQALGPGETPVSEFTDPVLGRLEWNEDDEGWNGNRDGVRFTLSYSRDSAVPPADVLVYAREMLSSQAILGSALESEKAKAAQKYPASLHEEIAGLRYDWLAFDRNKCGRYIFATLVSTAVVSATADRSWRIEFEGETCAGMGFDT